MMHNAFQLMHAEMYITRAVIPNHDKKRSVSIASAFNIQMVDLSEVTQSTLDHDKTHFFYLK